MLLEASRKAHSLEMEKEALIGAAAGTLARGAWKAIKPVGKFVGDHPWGTLGTGIMAAAPIVALKPNETKQRLTESVNNI